MGGAKAGMLDLRSGLSVSLQDAEECDDETLVMLSKGVAYTLATGTEPLVKKLYMQAREPLSRLKRLLIAPDGVLAYVPFALLAPNRDAVVSYTDVDSDASVLKGTRRGGEVENSSCCWNMLMLH